MIVLTTIAMVGVTAVMMTMISARHVTGTVPSGRVAPCMPSWPVAECARPVDGRSDDDGDGGGDGGDDDDDDDQLRNI